MTAPHWLGRFLQQPSGDCPRSNCSAIPGWLGGLPSASARRRAARLPLRVELLESRLAPAITFNGVAAGDATSSDAILWTRATDSANPTAAISLTAQVSTSSEFASFLPYPGQTVAAKDFTLKLDATGLDSGTRYSIASRRPTARSARSGPS
jgi:hypothetical protein